MMFVWQDSLSVIMSHSLNWLRNLVGAQYVYVYLGSSMSWNVSGCINVKLWFGIFVMDFRFPYLTYVLLSTYISK